jgi:hypothetical protein
MSGTNVASASSVGAVCAASGSNTTPLPCLGSTPNIGILDAVGESVSKPANSAGTTTISTNDKYPPGSQFNLVPGSTCANVNINAATQVVSYTAPAAGQTCTVLYNICGPAPASMWICKTATLTVNGIAPLLPTLALTKSASQNPFVVGKTGQFYTINITVNNGPTTAPVSLTDTLPAGIVTSGPITGTPVNLSGCPVSGSSNLTGCALPAGLANGTYAITLPVTVGSNAMSGLNTASVSSSGALCAGASTTTTQACSASTQNIGILDAVNDAVNQAASTNSTANLALNDKYVVGLQQFSLAIGSTCIGAAVSNTGVATYTSPAAGTTCTVVYQLCNPPTMQAVCDTATLTVTANPGIVIAVDKGVSQNPLVVGKPGQAYTIRIDIANGPSTAPILLTDVLPAGIVTSAGIAISGGSLSGCATAGAAGATNLSGCTIAAGASGVVYITIPITVNANATSGTNIATVAGGGSQCTGTATSATCSSSTSITGILDAVNDTDTKPANSSSTTNVASNDKAPAGAQYTLAGGSTCANAAVSAAGVASYTAPSSGGTCAVNYQVCVITGNQPPACDAATLTVNATVVVVPAVTLSSKTASQNPFVVGKPGQFYTINISIANGPTTSPISLMDFLPGGIVTSGAVTAQGGSLSGCTSADAAGATTLAGCTIAAGAATGNIVVTVPITVGINAFTGTNIATIIGGGDPLCTGLAPPCAVSTPVIGILDAINDAAFKPPTTSSTTTVANNDIMPPGSQFYLGTGSTCTGASMSAAGVASYTSPSAGGTCIVNYNLCAANQTICDTATLTVTSMLECANANVGSACIWYMIFEPNFYNNPAKYQNSYWATNPASYNPPIPRCTAPAPSTAPATVALTGHTSPRCMRKFIFVRRSPSLGDGYDTQLADQTPPTIELFPPD